MVLQGQLSQVREEKHAYTYTYTYTHTQAHTQCFPSVIKSSHARPTGSPWRIQRPTPTVPAGHRGGCFPWTCFMRPHVFSLGIGSFGKKKRHNSVDQDSGHQNNCWSQTHLSPAPLTHQTAQVFDWRGSQWVASHPQCAGGHLRSSHVCSVYVLLRISQRPCSQGTVSFGWEDFLNLSTT